MRVLIVEHSGKGGLQTYTDALCRGLSNAGANVTVLTSSAWPSEERPFAIERILSQFSYRQNTSGLGWAVDRLIRCSWNCKKRNDFAIRGNYDVVHLQGAVMPLLDKFFLKTLAKKKPLVLTVHDAKSHYGRFVSGDSSFRKNLQIPHRLIVHYQRGKQQLIKDWDSDGECIDVIPHGIMPVQNLISSVEAREKLSLPQDKKIILFFGSIRPNKGLDILLNAMDIVRRKEPGAMLVIAGQLQRSMSFEPYSELIEKLNLRENVQTFIKFIDDDQVDTFFCGVDVVALPYVKFEAQSGVLLRAYAHKKHVVVSNVGAMGELVTGDKVGLVVEPQNKEALADAVLQILENPNGFTAAYNQEIENKYNWNTIAELTIRSYEKAIEGFGQK